MSQVITFYSYKGGVGRSMALANVAVLLAQSGYRTLIIDWDLEAPGLELFFKELVDIDSIRQKPGLIELLRRDTPWQEILNPIAVPNGKEPIHFISAGKQDSAYYTKVLGFDNDKFYEEQDGGQYIEDLRDEWRSAYDFVLIDSRTGVTDLGGICTIQMPDILVLLFTSTEQGFSGILDVARRADAARQSLPFERLKLLCLPVLTRFEQTEFALSREWTKSFASRLEGVYRAWLPNGTKPDDLLLETKVPYIPYFSFGEKLAVLEQNVRDATGLGYAYESLTALLVQGLADADRFMGDRVAYVEKARIGGTRLPRVESRLKVFVSYTHKDKWLKDALLTRLSVLERTSGVELLSDADILPGDIWEHAITDQLRKANLYLVLITSDYIDSQWARKELDIMMIQARAPWKRLIPVRALHLRNLELYPRVRQVDRIQSIYFDPADPTSIDEAADQIRRVLATLVEPEKQPR